MEEKTLTVLGGYTNRAEATTYAGSLGQEYVLIKVLTGPTGLPITPLAYFPLTRKLLKEMYTEFRRKPTEES
jgi:hypothetical protein